MLRTISLAVLALVATFSFAQEAPHIILPSGHASDIIDLNFSADGKFLLTASDDGDIKLWETSSGKHIRSFAGAGLPDRYVITADNSKVIALSKEGGTISIWDVATSKLLKEIRHVGAYQLVKNLLLVASGKEDGKAVITRTDLTSMKELGATFPAQTYGHLFSDDGRLFVSTKLTKKKKLQASVIDVATGKEVSRFPVYGTPTAFTHDGKYLQTREISHDATFIGIYDIAAKKEAGYISASGASSTLTKDDKYLLTYNNGLTEVWKIPTGEKVAQLGEGSYETVLFLEDEKQVAHMNFYDTTLFEIWNIDGTLSKKITATSKDDRWANQTYSGDFGVTGNFIWSGSFDDQHLRIWNGVTGQLVTVLDSAQWAGSSLEPSTRIRKIVMSQDGKQVAFHRGQNIELWDVERYKKKRLGVTTLVYNAEFANADTSIVITSSDQRLRILNYKHGKLVIPSFYDEPRASYGTRVTNFGDSLWFIYGSYQKTSSGNCFLLDPQTLKNPERYFSTSHHSRAVSAHNGKYFVTFPGYLNEWDNGDPRLYNWPHTDLPVDIKTEVGAINCIPFPDDSKLLMGSSGQSVVWDVLSGKTIGTVKGTYGPKTMTPFDPTAQKFVLTTTDSIFYYDISTLQIIKTIPLEGVAHVEFASNGNLLAFTYTEYQSLSSITEIDANGTIKRQKTIWPAYTMSKLYFDGDLVSFLTKDSTILWQRSTDNIMKIKGTVNDIAADGRCLIVRNGNLLVFRDWKDMSDPLTVQFVAHAPDFVAYDSTSHFDITPDAKDVAYIVNGSSTESLKKYTTMMDRKLISNWFNRKK